MTIIAEIICNTAHVCHEVLTWSWLCAVRVCELHLESGGMIAASRLCPLGQQERREYNMSIATAAVLTKRD